MTTATVKGKALWQKTRQMLGRGYNSLTAKELQLASFLQQKIPAGYEITRLVFLFIKVAIGIFLTLFFLWVVSWILLIIFIVFAFLNTKHSIEEDEAETLIATVTEKNHTLRNDMSNVE